VYIEGNLELAHCHNAQPVALAPKEQLVAILATKRVEEELNFAIIILILKEPQIAALQLIPEPAIRRFVSLLLPQALLPHDIVRGLHPIYYITGQTLRAQHLIFSGIHIILLQYPLQLAIVIQQGLHMAILIHGTLKHAILRAAVLRLMAQA
jgi:hypothetical protein